MWKNYKKENNIDIDIPLIILKYDLKSNKTKSTKVEYEIYDPLTKKKLKIDSCYNTSVNIYVQVDLEENLVEIYNNAISQGYDVFDQEDVFYTDICSPYTSVNGTDMILIDRITDILNNTGYLCEEDCNYGGINNISKKVICECSPKLINSKNSSSNASSLSLFKDIYSNLKSKLNYKVLLCYELLFDSKYK